VRGTSQLCLFINLADDVRFAGKMHNKLQRPGLVNLPYFYPPSANKPGELCRTMKLAIEVACACQPQFKILL